MQPSSRYEIIDTIAEGEFAKVYRGRDRQLGREVAIKQIHEQYLSDPRQLERYWGESQLLASLQHPNVVTIYDVDRSRGWLILELMRGSLKRSPQSKPLNLDLLRMVLAGCLNALQFLHTNGVIHGDIKPSNMLIDMQNRVKLGDFGLARRASSEEGSLLKGTTKYMAPELIATDFGSVGPASDLYSLGFSAYELICGARFEDLFPGLASFGRNRQIAWMMWHSAADRRLPEIGRVLEGVPEDLARVIDRLVVKDQAARYKSATEALADLRTEKVEIDRPPETVDPEEEAARAAEARKRRRRRLGAIVAVVCSLLLCVVMLLPGPTETAKKRPELPQGVLRQVYLAEQTITLELPDGNPKEVKLKGETIVEINGRPALVRDLREGDEVLVKVYRKPSGQLVTELQATRPAVSRGRVASVDVDQRRFLLQLEGAAPGEQLEIDVPADLKIRFNGAATLDGRDVTLADLRRDDRVVVHHLAGKTQGRRATELGILRVVTTEGVLRGVDTAKETLTISQGEGDKLVTISLPLAPKCEVTINQHRVLDERQLKPADLRPGDKVKLTHDEQIARVDAYRVLGRQGVIARIRAGAEAIDVTMKDGSGRMTFLVGPQTTISLGGQTVELGELREGDRVEITHDSPDAKTPRALSIAATRPADPRRWAALVSAQDYEDASLARLEFPETDAKLLRAKLVERHRLPEDQVFMLADPSRVRLEQGLAEFFNRVPADAELVVYFAGHAFKTDDGKIYLAPKNFELGRAALSGVALQWLADRMEQCPAKEKLLLLDCSHADAGTDPAKQPSTAEMIGTLDALPGRGPFRTVTAVASCSKGQRGQGWPEKQHGLFAYYLAEGFTGRADTNHDNRLEPTELFGYVKNRMAAAGVKLGQPQTPRLFLPDDRPPRLSENAKKAIRRLAALAGESRVDKIAASSAYTQASRRSGDQPEPELLYALLLTKGSQLTDALRIWQQLKLERPGNLIPLQAIAWIHFVRPRASYDPGVDALVELVGKIPRPKKPGTAYSADCLALFDWAGQLREFAAVATREHQRPSADRLAALDAAVAAHGGAAVARYDAGRKKSRAVWNRFETNLGKSRSEAETAKLQIERHRLVHYATFPYKKLIEQILAGLDW